MSVPIPAQGSQDVRHLLELLETAFNAPWTVLLSLALHGPFCRTETAERVDIPENAWVVVTEVSRCSVVDPGQLQVYGENTQSKEKRPILALSTEEDTHVEYHPEGYLTITLPNLVEITFQSDQLDKYKIEYRYLPKDDPVIALDANLVHYRELTIVGANGSSPGHNAQALQLIASGAVGVEDLITHRLPLERVIEAFDIVGRGAAIKVTIEP